MVKKKKLLGLIRPLPFPGGQAKIHEQLFFPKSWHLVLTLGTISYQKLLMADHFLPYVDHGRRRTTTNRG